MFKPSQSRFYDCLTCVCYSSSCCHLLSPSSMIVSRVVATHPPAVICRPDLLWLSHECLLLILLLLFVVPIFYDCPTCVCYSSSCCCLLSPSSMIVSRVFATHPPAVICCPDLLWLSHECLLLILLLLFVVPIFYDCLTSVCYSSSCCYLLSRSSIYECLTCVRYSSSCCYLLSRSSMIVSRVFATHPPAVICCPDLLWLSHVCSLLILLLLFVVPVFYDCLTCVRYSSSCCYLLSRSSMIVSRVFATHPPAVICCPDLLDPLGPTFPPSIATFSSLFFLVCIFQPFAVPMCHSLTSEPVRWRSCKIVKSNKCHQGIG